MSYPIHSVPVSKSLIDWGNISETAISLVVNLVKKVGQAVQSCLASIVNVFYNFFYLSNLCEPRLIWPVLPIGSLGNFSVNGANIAKVKQGDAVDVDRLKYVVNCANPRVDLNELLEQFDTVFGICNARDPKLNKFFFQDGGVSVFLGKAKGLIHRNYIEFLTTSDCDTSAMTATEAANMLLIVKGIAYELRSPDLSLEKKKQIFELLANGAGHCPPRRYEEAMIVYRRITNQITSMEEVVLENVQLIKESLFRAHYSLSAESAATLNYIRKIVGLRLGLDSNPVSLNDPYIHMNDARSPSNPEVKHTTEAQFLHVFNQIYTPENIFNLMKQWLNERCKTRDFACEVGLFFSNYLCNLNSEYEQDLVVLNAYQDQTTFQITDKGILFLLTHFGILRERV